MAPLTAPESRVSSFFLYYRISMTTLDT